MSLLLEWKQQFPPSPSVGDSRAIGREASAWSWTRCIIIWNFLESLSLSLSVCQKSTLRETETHHIERERECVIVRRTEWCTWRRQLKNAPLPSPAGKGTLGITYTCRRRTLKCQSLEWKKWGRLAEKRATHAKCTEEIVRKHLVGHHFYV